jgi:hypothetical protein
MVLKDLAFLTRDSILVLLEEEDTEAIMLGIFSIPEKRITIRFRLPFPGPPWIAYFLHEQTTSYGDNYPTFRAMLEPDSRHRIVSLMYCHRVPR